MLLLEVQVRSAYPKYQSVDRSPFSPGPLFLVSTLFIWAVHSDRIALCSLSCFLFPTHHPFSFFFWGLYSRSTWYWATRTVPVNTFLSCLGTIRLSERGRTFFRCTFAQVYLLPVSLPFECWHSAIERRGKLGIKENNPVESCLGFPLESVRQMICRMTWGGKRRWYFSTVLLPPLHGPWCATYATGLMRLLILTQT
jgi:hypothetical protein